jgi:hypothetical protein
MKAPKRIRLAPIVLLKNRAWFYEEPTFLDVYVHVMPGQILNFRIRKTEIKAWLRRVE